MAATDIQAKVKKGLAKAINKTGGAGAALVYKMAQSGGGGTPVNPIPITESPVFLVDAVVKSYNAYLVDDTDILATDKQLVSNGDVVISQDDFIEIGSQRYIVKNVDVKSPAGIPLAYISQIRLQ
jgi:hypothetical protein